MSNNQGLDTKTLHVPWYGYAMLIFAILFFSGLLPKVPHLAESTFLSGKLDWIKAFDFGVLQGKFGTITGNTSFRGSGGIGAREGFIFALTLVPSVMLALGFVEIVNRYDGIKAAQKLLSPILKVLIGVPGITGLAIISSLQSTDAGASLTKSLHDEKKINDKELTILGMFQFTAGATVTNFLTSGVAVYQIVEPRLAGIIVYSFIIMFVMKIFAANLMRICIKNGGVENNEHN